MIETKDALELARENYTEYSRYVAEGRAYPCIYDGCKSSYKRSIYGMWKDAPRRIVKVAELAAFALPYHPHPTAISGVIVQLGDNGNKLKLMKTQGNWGDSSKGIQASADRYIGGMLSDASIALLCDSMEYVKYIKGEIENEEPMALPALIPLCFINGLSGIPSGLPRLNIPCLNISDMFEYYLEKIRHKNINFKPAKYPKINSAVPMLSTKSDWETIMECGRGTIRFAPKMKLVDNVITITALPDSKNIEHVYKLLDNEITQGKIDVRDETTKTTRIVIEKVYRKQCDMDAVYKKLYSKLQSSVSYNMAFFGDDNIYVPCGFDKVVSKNLGYIYETSSNRISIELAKEERKLKVLDIIESLKENDLSKLFSMTYETAVKFISKTFNCDDDISKAVLSKPMSYLTKGHLNEIKELKNSISKLKKYSNDVWMYLEEKYVNTKEIVLKEIESQKNLK